ncbi:MULTISPECIES: septal ring lytic transglycosylase RlpA family protein [Legionella]|uniref:Endolytic peptidoglycan transglycosylase RlpA n=1 Tax=Legionella maceachernii TaxID=466 RepID=A0A0W0W2N3_9GAMM|nr:septal ring lytic transglycosylase RlpA family protein [Legionella maceachernii]KTD26166.1 rare lipoprotein A [Legionella maceachernii]SJZ71772.1 rare lipoprotein A [Legionella maceachernii]SUP02389.1 RlpA-like protein precursor [Legionella maceachernii]
MRFFYIFFLLGLLAGCAQQEYSHNPSTKGLVSQSNAHRTNAYRAKNAYATSQKDGAPTGPIPRFFKEAKPKREPFSRYGNPDSYAIAGRTYKVMQSSGGYRMRGIASWYGTKFHSKRTSSGDKYDMYAMTAAHKTLPLPTYVRVRNLSNGREAIVKVNDRGPFHSDRVIDLSYAAAAKLGIFPKGTAPVEIEALSTGNQVAHYYIQAGAFSSQQLADSLKKKLAKLTPSPVTIEKYRQRYIVKVGPFADKRISDNLQTKLAHNGVKGTFSLLQ